jgi:hypothetical protein
MIVYLSVAAGVAISVLLPLIRALLPLPPQPLRGLPPWERCRPYIMTGIFSLVVALLVVAAMGSQLDTWSKALIAGYLWDSTLQKATSGNLALTT